MQIHVSAECHGWLARFRRKDRCHQCWDLQDGRTSWHYCTFSTLATGRFISKLYLHLIILFIYSVEKKIVSLMLKPRLWCSQIKEELSWPEEIGPDLVVVVQLGKNLGAECRELGFGFWCLTTSYADFGFALWRQIYPQSTVLKLHSQDVKDMVHTVRYVPVRPYVLYSTHMDIFLIVHHFPAVLMRNRNDK